MNRRRRWVLIAVVAVLLILGTAYAAVRILFEGPQLADKVAFLLNKRMRGRIQIGSIEWEPSALKTAITGGWVPVTLRDVRVWDDCALADSGSDPEEIRTTDPNVDCTPDDKPDPDPTSKRRPRKLLLRTGLLTAELDAHAAMFGSHDLVLRHIYLHGGEALIEQTREPQPLHAYNKTIVSIVSAFYPRLKAGFRAGVYADKPPPIFDLRDIHLDHVNLTINVVPSTNKDGTSSYAMSARIEDVNTNDAYLYMDGRDPLVQKFYVRLGVTGQRGHIRIIDDGPREAFSIPGEGQIADAWAKGRSAKYELEVGSIELRRLGQLPTDWAHFDKTHGYNYIANSLDIDATLHTLPCVAKPDPKDGAEVRVFGGLQNYWDRPYDGKWAFHLDAKNLGPTVQTCIKSAIHGDHMGGTIEIGGPFIALPRVDLDLHDVDVDIPLSKKEEPIELTIAKLKGNIDLVNDEGTIDETTARERTGKDPGEVLLSARFGLKPYHAQADVDILKPIDVGRFLPKQIATSVGSRLTGKLSVDGDIETGFQIYDFNLRLGPADVFVLPRENGRLFATDYFEKMSLERIHFVGGKTNAVINGKINYVDGEWERAIRIDGTSPDLGEWLKRFGLPQIAQSAGGGTVVITGRGNQSTVTVSTQLQGVPCIGSVQTQATLEGSLATFKVTSGGFGGALSGDGVINTKTKTIEKFHMTGSGLDAGKVCGINKTVAGTIDKAEVDLHGTIDPKRPIDEWASLAKIYASMPHAKIYGDTYSDLALCLNRSYNEDFERCGADPNIEAEALTECNDGKEKGGSCAVIKASRDGGGSLKATIADVPAIKVGSRTLPPHLGGAVKLDDVPMSVLDPFVGANTMGGLFNAVLHLQGSFAAPQATGSIAWLRGWVLDAFVADPQFQVEPTTLAGGMPGVILRGSALSGALGVTAVVGTKAPYPVDLTVSGRRIEVDQFVDLSKKLGIGEPIQAWASGTVQMHTELLPANGKREPAAWVEITELEAILDHTSRDGRHVPLTFELQPKTRDALAMSLLVTPTTISLACRNPAAPGGVEACPAQLVTPAGVVEITGSATAATMSIVANGDLKLDKLGALLENQLDAISGVLHLEANVTGTFGKPSYDATLTVTKPVFIRPTGADTDVQVAQDSQFRILNGTIGFNSVTLAVAGDRGGEASELHVKGTIGLAGLSPNSWGLLIDGRIAGKLLQIVAPSAIAQAGGVARIDGDLVLQGKGALPQVNGTITFDPDAGRKSPLTIVPRALRRELALTAGSLDISTEDSGGHRTYMLDVANDNAVTASIDGEGRLEHVKGGARFRDGTPESAIIDLDADNVPFRNGDRTLELTFAANDVELAFENNRWTAKGVPGSDGTITVVNGAYRRNFDLAEAIKPVPPTVAPAKPLWDEYPSIGNADVQLKLVVQRFSVDNNIAHIDFGGNIDITGTPRDLRLQGSISAGGGRGDFKIPLTRASFASTRGTIDFSSNQRAANPTLALSSEANYQDLSGQQHVITLAITGTLEQPLWDLKTNTGLDKSQTLALLFLGRSPEQLRRSLGDQSIGVVDPTRGETSTNPSTGVGDQVVKDLAGDWVSSLLGNSLTKITGLDVLRFELGFGSVGAHAEKKLFENIKLIGDYETTVRGQTINGHLELRTPWHPSGGYKVVTNDRFTLQGVALSKTYSDPADQAQDISDLQAKFVYRLFIP